MARLRQLAVHEESMLNLLWSRKTAAHLQERMAIQQPKIASLWVVTHLTRRATLMQNVPLVYGQV